MASCYRAYANQNACYPALQTFEGDFEADCVSDDNRATQISAQFSQIQGTILGGDVPNGRDRALDHKNIGAGFLGDLSVTFCLLRDGADCCQDSAVFHLFDASGD